QAPREAPAFGLCDPLRERLMNPSPSIHAGDSISEFLSLILFFKLSNLVKKYVKFSSALKIRRSFIQNFKRGNCATISRHREEISRVRFNISSLRLLKRLQLCSKTP
ncbi:hypothetical protein ALC62_13228, partial [Cyphomyrmex costatus]